MSLYETSARYLSGSKSTPLLIIVLGAAGVIGTIAAQAPVIVIVLIFAMVLALVVVVSPDVATLAVIFLLYANAAVVAARFHNVPYMVAAMVPLPLALPLANYVVFRRQKLIINWTFLLLVLFLGVQALGALFSTRFDEATSNLITFLIEGIGLYFLVTNAMRTPEMLRRTVWVLLIAGAFLGGLSFYQQVTGTFSNNYWGFAQVTGEGFGTGVESIQGEVQQQRLGGPVGEKNYYAQIMLMLVPLGLFRLWGERSTWLRISAAIATGLILLGVALTFSRGAAVGFMLVLVIMTAMRYIKPYQLVVTLLALVLLLQVVPQYGTRLASLQRVLGVAQEDSAGVAGTDLATQGRLGEMAAAALVFADHPIIGVGPGLFKYYYPKYAESIGLQIHTTTREAHSLYLDVAANTGVLGFVLFMAILLGTLRNLAHTRKRYARSHPELANLATSFLLAIVTYMTTGLFLSLAYERYLWVMLALAGAVGYIAKNSMPTGVVPSGKGGSALGPTSPEAMSAS
jgi:putative inorganic carbon (HCO3(-)) transporter